MTKKPHSLLLGYSVPSPQWFYVICGKTRGRGRERTAPKKNRVGHSPKFLALPRDAPDPRQQCLLSHTSLLPEMLPPRGYSPCSWLFGEWRGCALRCCPGQYQSRSLSSFPRHLETKPVPPMGSLPTDDWPPLQSCLPSLPSPFLPHSGPPVFPQCLLSCGRELALCFRSGFPPPLGPKTLQSPPGTQRVL